MWSLFHVVPPHTFEVTLTHPSTMPIVAPTLMLLELLESIEIDNMTLENYRKHGKDNTLVNFSFVTNAGKFSAKDICLKSKSDQFYKLLAEEKYNSIQDLLFDCLVENIKNARKRGASVNLVYEEHKVVTDYDEVNKATMARL